MEEHVYNYFFETSKKCYVCVECNSGCYVYINLKFIYLL